MFEHTTEIRCFEHDIWINDPENGISNVGIALRVAMWDVFIEHGIDIPYPQRDVHIKPQPV
ncbi:hypothetical protein Dvar_28820 [Desulfosarcina variabilis str. Montpellier]